MGRPAEWMTTRTGRPAMRSPGRPPARREVERAFWVKIAEGLTSEDAAVACGVSGPVGSRWFRERGGMPSIQLTVLSGRYLSFLEREEIARRRAQGATVREVARRLGRSPSTVSRELRRNAATRGGRLDYRAGIAQWKAELMARRPKTAKLADHDRLREYVQDRLAGAVGLRMRRWCRGQSRGRGVAGTNPSVRIGGGRRRGVRSRSRTGFRSISLMMSPCGSVMRPSTRPSMSRAVARSNVSWSPACAPAGRCASRALGPAARQRPCHSQGQDQRASCRG